MAWAGWMRALRFSMVPHGAASRGVIWPSSSPDGQCRFHHRPVRFGLQQTEVPRRRIAWFERTWYVVCTQRASDEVWVCRRIHDGQLTKELRRLGFAHHRDDHVVLQQARAAVREYGPGQGCIEYDLDREHDQGPVRRCGDLRQSRAAEA